MIIMSLSATIIGISALVALLLLFIILHSCSKSSLGNNNMYIYSEDVLSENEELFLRLLNDDREFNNLCTLKPDEYAGRLAYLKNIEMITSNTLSHDGIKERRQDMFDRGVKLYNEIIGKGYYSMKGAFKDFKNSADHNTIITDKRYNAIGVDITADDNGTKFYTIIFIQI